MNKYSSIRKDNRSQRRRSPSYDQKKRGSFKDKEKSEDNKSYTKTIKSNSNFTDYMVNKNENTSNKLILNNLSFKTDSDSLLYMINTFIKQNSLKIYSIQPINSIVILKDNKAIIEFRTIEDLEVFYRLSNIELNGVKLYFSKFNETYISGNQLDYNKVIGKRISPPSKVLLFVGILSQVSYSREEIIEDILDECNKYGVVVYHDFPNNVDYELLNKNIVGYMDNLFVEFGSVDQAVKIRKELCGKKYNGKIYDIQFHPVDKLYRREFEIVEERIYTI